MNKDKLIEQSVSDAITAKPIRFSVQYFEKQEVKIEVTKKIPLHRLIPFFYKTVKILRIEKQDIEAVKDFEICPPTVGKMQILSKLYLQLGFDEGKLKEEPHLEAMRVCAAHTDIITRLMAVSISSTEKDLLDDKGLDNLAHFFKWHCTPEDFASCMIAILTQVDYANFTTSIRLMKMLALNKPTQKRANRIEQ